MANSLPDGRHLGQTYLMYVKAGPSAPVAPDEITSYSLVGRVTAWNRQKTAASVDIRDKDGPGTIAGDVTAVVNVTVNFVNTGDNGQEILEDAIDTGTEIYWMKSDNTIGHVQEYGRGVVTSSTWDEADNTAATKAFVLSVNGTITKGEVD